MKLLSSILLSTVSVAAAGSDNLITNLPGAPKVGFDMYSGYISLAGSDRKMFYWFVRCVAVVVGTDMRHVFQIPDAHALAH